jgi:hypothetical protein
MTQDFALIKKYCNQAIETVNKLFGSKNMSPMLEGVRRDNNLYCITVSFYQPAYGAYWMFGWNKVVKVYKEVLIDSINDLVVSINNVYYESQERGK